MKVSVALSQRLGPQTIDYAARAEALALDGVFVFDHLVPLADPFAPALEAAAALGALAATLRTRVGSLVVRATLRPPAVTAAIAAAIAAIAHEPPVIGLGAGDGLTKTETERFGLPFPPLGGRLAVLAESVEAVRAVGVTTWVGGVHPAVMEIAASADGWNMWEPPMEQLEALLRGRPTRSSYVVSWGGRVLVGEPRPDVWLSGNPSAVAEKVRQLAGLGLDELVLAPLPATDPAALDRIAEVVLLA